MNPSFSAAANRLPGLFRSLMDADPFLEKGRKWQEKKSGVYTFSEDGLVVHVGRTRNLMQRLRGNVSRSHYSASFAFKRSREAMGVNATYRPEGSRQHLMDTPDFATEFDRQLARVRAMQVRFLEVPDPVDQYLLELYAVLELGLPLSEFETH